MAGQNISVPAAIVLITLAAMIAGSAVYIYWQSQMPPASYVPPIQTPMPTPPRNQTIAPAMPPASPTVVMPAPSAGENDPKFCRTDGDCACGVKIGTKQCFVGNRDYVNTLIQCPDFCSGIDGRMRVVCVNNLCTQSR